MNNFAVRKPTPNGAERLRTVQMRYAQLRTVKKNGTYRDASLKSLSVSAGRDACHASGTKATVNYTLFKNKDNKMKLSFNKNNLPWMLIVLGSLATFYGYNLLFHVVLNV